MPHMTTLLIGWVAALLVAERLAPAREPIGGWPRIGRNVALGVMAMLVAPLLLAGVGRLSDCCGARFLPDNGWGLALKFVALDCWTYALHRAYHRVPALWRLHAAHHLDEHLDATSAFRFHLGEIMVSGGLRTIPALALGVGPGEMLGFETLLVASAVFHHSNLLLPTALERVLGWLIVTPRMHRLHHHARRADTDSNYASLLTIWDRLFGSRGTATWRRDMVIGVEGARDVPVAALMLWPFAPGFARAKQC